MAGGMGPAQTGNGVRHWRVSTESEQGVPRVSKTPAGIYSGLWRGSLSVWVLMLVAGSSPLPKPYFFFSIIFRLFVSRAA